MSDTLLLRADADERIGTGHVMRCLALAEGWHARGGRVHLVTRTRAPGLLQRASARGIGLTPLDAPASSPADRDATLAAAERLGASWVVLDGYAFDEPYQRALAEQGPPTLVIDDLAELPAYHAAALLNQNSYAEQLAYPLAGDCLPLLGTRYALLRGQFAGWRGHPRATPPQARRVLVTLGGSDPDNVTARVVEALAALDVADLEARVIVGAANPHRAALERAAAAAPAGRISLLGSVDDMPAQMAWADLAVAAGGTTAWELLFMRLPAALVVLAPNQTRVAGGLHALGAARSLGEAAGLSAGAIGEALRALIDDAPARRHMAELGGHIVDGMGVDRVTSTLAARVSGEEWRLRPAAPDDAFTLWQWANDAGARANSFNPEPIPWERHLPWFQARLASASSRIWLLERYGAPVGVIRYDRTGPDSAQISFAAARSQRGRGVGTRLLTMSLAPAAAALGLRSVEGAVFAENAASARAFLKAGYTQAAAEQIGGRPCLLFRRALG